MDPVSLITAGVSAAGFFTSLFGNDKRQGGAELAAQGAREKAAASMEQARLEQQVEAQRMRAMEIDAKRKLRENVRNAQRMSMQAIATGVNQGAEFGTGIAGGQGQIAGEFGVNQLGITQNLEIGRNIFSLNAGISQQKIRMAQAEGTIAQGQGQISEGQGLMQLGQSLGSFASPFAKATYTGANMIGGGIFSGLSGGFSPGIYK